MAFRHDYKQVDNEISTELLNTGHTKLQAEVIASRVSNLDQALGFKTSSLSVIEHPRKLAGADKAASRIASAIMNNEVIGVFSDYDVDGLTGGSVIQIALSHYFSHKKQNIVSMIGNRFKESYGLSDVAVDKIIHAVKSGQIKKPSVIITVDCGSSDEPRIQRLRDFGIEVIVTDHHAIPPAGVPKSAFVTVNPQQPYCLYKDKNIAGVAVGWLVMSLVREKLILEDYLLHDSKKLTGLLDYVALGTVADSVDMSSLTNRAFVRTGLKLINANVRPAWQAIKKLTGQDEPFNEQDLGFKIGPRINARSRMDDPYAASRYLLASTLSDAEQYLQLLDDDNQLRKETQKKMTDIAKSKLAQCEDTHCTIVFDDSFHEGVQGIVASKMTEITGKPSIVFSPTSDVDVVKGSGRTVKGIDLKEVFTSVENAMPGIHIKVGGHKGAFGCAIKKSDIPTYKALVNKAIASMTDLELSPFIEVDGLFDLQNTTLADAIEELKELAPFGREFEPPTFEMHLTLISQEMVGKENRVHCKLSMYDEKTNSTYDGIYFNAISHPDEHFPFTEGDEVTLFAQLGENTFRGKTTVQLEIKDIVKRQQNKTTMLAP